jgi:hypothetical protein
MGRKTNSTPSFIKSDALFITKPFDVANYFNDFFIDKVGKLRQEMPSTNSEASYSYLSYLFIYFYPILLQFSDIQLRSNYDLVSSLQLPNRLGRGEGRVVGSPKHDPPKTTLLFHFLTPPPPPSSEDK